MIKLLIFGETCTCSDPLTVCPVPSTRAISVTLTVSLPVTVRRALTFPPEGRWRERERKRERSREICLEWISPTNPRVLEIMTEFHSWKFPLTCERASLLQTEVTMSSFMSLHNIEDEVH